MLLKNLDTGRKQYLTFKVKQTQLRIPADNILYLERNLRETFIYTGNKTYTTRDKLSELQQQLPSFFICFVLLHPVPPFGAFCRVSLVYSITILTKLQLL